jgi:uncharacterized damage-inducible protein DinB
MITPSFVRTMTAYNSEMNRRLYAAADRIPDQERRADRGAFWKSIHGTLCHLVWADQMWMSRFAGWARPTVGLKDSAGMIEAWEALKTARTDADSSIEAWAAKVEPEWIAGDLEWFSGASRKHRRAPRGFVLMHFFNHQTHHRGQAHALITACGEETGDTDLMILVKPQP